MQQIFLVRLSSGAADRDRNRKPICTSCDEPRICSELCTIWSRSWARTKGGVGVCGAHWRQPFLPGIWMNSDVVVELLENDVRRMVVPYAATWTTPLNTLQRAQLYYSGATSCGGKATFMLVLHMPPVMLCICRTVNLRVLHSKAHFNAQFAHVFCAWGPGSGAHGQVH